MVDEDDDDEDERKRVGGSQYYHMIFILSHMIESKNKFSFNSSCLMRHTPVNVSLDDHEHIVI